MPAALSVPDARKLAPTYRALVEQGIDPRQREEHVDLTFGEFDQVYLAYSRQHKRSRANDASTLKCWLLLAFAHVRLKDLRRQHVEAFLTEQRQTHTPAPVNRHLTLLCAMLRRTIALGYLDKNPCAGIGRMKESGPRQQTLIPEQAGRLLDALAQERKATAAAALSLMLYTGTRKLECLHGRWEHVDLTRCVWLLPKTKAGKAQDVHLSRAAVELLGISRNR